MELVIVMLVMVILTAVAIPSLSGLSQAKDNLATGRIVSALRYAQSTALAQNRRTWVLFSTGADTCSVYMEDLNSPGKANRLAMADPLTRAAMVVTLNAGEFGGVTINTANIGGTPEVEFDSQGRPYDGNGTLLAADGTVTLSGAQTITVTKNTGHVRVN